MKIALAMENCRQVYANFKTMYIYHLFEEIYIHEYYFLHEKIKLVDNNAHRLKTYKLKITTIIPNNID